MAKFPRLMGMVVEDNILDYGLHGYLIRYAQQGGQILDNTPVQRMVKIYAAMYESIQSELRAMGIDVTIGDDET